MSALKHIPALDGIRAFAVLLVILFHAKAPFMKAGYLGVDAFFVLSGFIITTLLLREFDAKGTINFLHFYIRRLLRLYPALLLLLALVLGCFWLVLGKPPTEVRGFYRDAFFAATYLSDFALHFEWMSRASALMHTWSLSVEEHYYIIWPFVLLMLARHVPRPRLAKTLGAIFLLSLAWKMAACVYFDAALAYRFDLRDSGLLLGGWLAAYRHGGGKIAEYKALLAASFILFLACLFTDWPRVSWTFVLGVSVTEIFTCFLIYAVVEEGQSRAAKFLGGAVPVYLGKISYGMYLFHYPIAVYVSLGNDWRVTFVVSYFLALAVASASYFAVERPALALAKKYRESRMQAAD